MTGKEMYSINCKDAGVTCDFHVCDSSEDEVISAAQDHARRVHGKEVSKVDVRKIVKTGALACG